MRTNSLIALSLCAMLFSCDFQNSQELNKGPHVRDEDYVMIARRIRREAAFKMCKEKGLQLAGVGGGMMSHIQRMSLGFHFFHEVDLTEARKITVYAVNEYLTAINSSKEVRPYLKNYPFTSKEVSIRIWIYKPDHTKVPLGEIESISATDGTITYRINIGENNYSNNDLCEETYEEALKIVQEEAALSEKNED